MLSKARVVFYPGNNISLGTACGKYHRCSTMAVVDAGDSDILNEWLSLYSWGNESKKASSHFYHLFINHRLEPLPCWSPFLLTMVLPNNKRLLCRAVLKLIYGKVKHYQSLGFIFACLHFLPHILTKDLLRSLGKIAKLINTTSNGLLRTVGVIKLKAKIESHTPSSLLQLRSQCFEILLGLKSERW